MNYARQRGMRCVARGSAAGSLVAYVLGITNVDPLRYELLFERFLNPERMSMPDIDMDFPDDRREEVIRYVAEKYGWDRVGQVVTFNTMAASAAVRDVGRVMGLQADADRVARLIPTGPKVTISGSLDGVRELKQLYEQSQHDAPADGHGARAGGHRAQHGHPRRGRHHLQRAARTGRAAATARLQRCQRYLARLAV